MKSFLSLVVLVGIFSLFSLSCQAQESVVLTKTQQRDVTDLVAKIRAKLPKGWNVEYMSKGSKLKNDLPQSKGIAYDLIEVTRLETTKMWPPMLSNMNSEHFKPVDGAFRLTFAVAPFWSKEAYDKAVESNQSIQKQLAEMRQILDNMGIGHKFDSYIPSTPEQEVKVKAYTDLKAQIISLPQFHFQGVGLNSWGDRESSYYRVRDKAIRRECAYVTQDVFSFLTSYTGEKMKIDEETLKD